MNKKKKDVTWMEAKEAANSIMKELCTGYNGIDFVKEVYNGALPHCMNNIFKTLYITKAIRRNDPRVQTLLNAEEQLQTKCYIGNGEDD